MAHKDWTGGEGIIGGIERRKGRAGWQAEQKTGEGGTTHLPRKKDLADLKVFFFIMFI